MASQHVPISSGALESARSPYVTPIPSQNRFEANSAGGALSTRTRSPPIHFDLASERYLNVGSDRTITGRQPPTIQHDGARSACLSPLVADHPMSRRRNLPLPNLCRAPPRQHQPTRNSPTSTPRKNHQRDQAPAQTLVVQPQVPVQASPHDRLNLHPSRTRTEDTARPLDPTCTATVTLPAAGCRWADQVGWGSREIRARRT